MIATRALRIRCLYRGTPALLIFYPDSRIVRICTEDGRCFREMRWHFGWEALLRAVHGEAETETGTHETAGAPLANDG